MLRLGADHHGRVSDQPKFVTYLIPNQTPVFDYLDFILNLQMQKRGDEDVLAALQRLSERLATDGKAGHAPQGSVTARINVY